MWSSFRSWSETIVVAKTRFFVSESGLIGLKVVSGAYLSEWSRFSGFGVGLGCVSCTVHGVMHRTHVRVGQWGGVMEGCRVAWQEDLEIRNTFAESNLEGSLGKGQRGRGSLPSSGRLLVVRALYYPVRGPVMPSLCSLT